MDRNFWLSLLGLKPDAKVPDIKKAWRQRAADTHPDHGGKAEDFRNVTHAYKMLTDESYRRKEQASKNARTQQNLSLNLKAHIDWIDSFFGRKVTLSWNITELDDNDKVIEKEHQLIDMVTVEIQPGFTGGEFHFQGRGLKKGSLMGDLYLNVLVAQDKRYSYLDGEHILCTEAVPLSMLLTGGKLDVETPWGSRILTIKPGTMPGTRIPIKRAGLNERGNLFVAVNAKFPGEQELKSKDYQGLKIEWDISEEEYLSDDEKKLMDDFIRFNE